jgi:hypothetical protein
MDYQTEAAEGRIARRLARLFRIERLGGFERRSPATASRLVERRGALIAQLIALDDRRGSVFAPRTGALDEALRALAREVERGRDSAVARADRAMAELQLRRGGWLQRGIRGGARGRLLGRG